MLKSAPDQKISWLTENLASFDDNFVDLTTSLIRDILLHKINQSDFCIHTYLTSELKTISTTHSLPGLLKTLKSLFELPFNLKKNINPQLLWQSIFLKF